MSSISVVLSSGVVSTVTDIPGRTPKVTFVSEAGVTMVIPYAPSEMTLDSLSGVLGVIERPGRTELVVYERSQLPKISMQLFVASDNQAAFPNASIEPWLTQFRKNIATFTRWRFTFGPQVSSDWWRFTEASITTQTRHPVTNEITVAQVDIQLIKASDIAVSVGPVTGGAAAPAPTTTPTTAYRTHTIVSGDTLWALAQRYLGSGLRWTEIAKLSGISDPRLLRIGQVVKIPLK